MTRRTTASASSLIHSRKVTEALAYIVSMLCLIQFIPITCTLGWISVVDHSPRARDERKLRSTSLSEVRISGATVLLDDMFARKSCFLAQTRARVLMFSRKRTYVDDNLMIQQQMECIQLGPANLNLGFQQTGFAPSPEFPRAALLNPHKDGLLSMSVTGGPLRLSITHMSHPLSLVM